MKDKTVQWLWQVPGRKKGYIAALTAIQILLGGYGVVYALLLRNIVNSAVSHDSRAFWHFVVFIVLLVLGQIALHAVVRWLNELSKSTLENALKQRLMNNILRRDYAAVSAVHSGEWLNRMTNDTVVVCQNLLVRQVKDNLVVIRRQVEREASAYQFPLARPF